MDPQVAPSPTPDAGPTSAPTPDATPTDPPVADTPPPTPTPPTPTDTPTDTPSDPPSDAPPAASIDAAPLLTTTILYPLAYQLSPGQRQGSVVGEAIPIYKLAAPAVDPQPNSPHGAASLAGTDCATCHAAHTAQQADLLQTTGAQAKVCLACHAAGGSAVNVASTFLNAPANDPVTDRYFSHPVDGLTATGSAVTCADCHNPHLSGTAKPVQSVAGWSAGGAIATAKGARVTNGPAGSAPTYTVGGGGFLSYEYELCLNCHSGATSLPARNANQPSWWALDAGIEFNPANASYHPIEAAGNNLSAQMAASLAGTSPFKAWDYRVDSTIRCTSCHGDPSTVSQVGSGTPLTPAPDALEASHASTNRGLLIAPYRDRDLKAQGEVYQAADFALCYLCHAERPFADPNIDPSAADTSFPVHGRHLAGDLARNTPGQGGAGLSIDTAGDGQGLAICSECHFRTHSTAIAYQPGDTAPVARADGSPGLVNFAPNVNGVRTWAPPDAAGSGSCTLTCHGHAHSAAADTYTVAPATGFSASVTTGSAGVEGLTVQFTDATRFASTGTATWSWNFGDGVPPAGEASLQSPSHTYAARATPYTVTLTVTRNDVPGLATTMTRTAYITVSP